MLTDLRQVQLGVSCEEINFEESLVDFGGSNEELKLTMAPPVGLLITTAVGRTQTTHNKIVWK